MGTPQKQHAIRRSTRLPLEIPVFITSLDDALESSEHCNTTLVNAHGCGIIAQHRLPQGTRVRLEVIPAKRHTTAQVADVVSLGGEPETWLLGLELDEPGNFWGLEYAPSDWRTEESPPPPAESSPADQEQAPVARPAPLARRWRLTDISAGSCYLEASEPFPAGTLVLVSIRVADSECLLDGVVRVAHPGIGMGIEFTPRAQDHRDRMEQLIGRLLSYREVPRVLIGRKERVDKAGLEPNRAAETSELESPDQLLELIRSGNAVPVEQFQDDLKKQRLGKREEERIEVSLPVLLTGTDAGGRAFQQMVTTCNVSRRGAQLKGVERQVRPGDTIFLTYRGTKEEFRVAWTGMSVTPAAGQIGVVTLERNTSLWDPVLESPAQQDLEVVDTRRMDGDGNERNQN